MPKRSKKRQKAHDKKVLEIARKLRKQGYKVKADLPGFDKPEPIGKYRHIPDIVAKKRGREVIYEIETPETLKRDKKQHETFRKSASHKKGAKFRLIVVE